MATRKQREAKQARRLQHMEFTKARGKLGPDGTVVTRAFVNGTEVPVTNFTGSPPKSRRRRRSMPKRMVRRIGRKLRSER